VPKFPALVGSDQSSLRSRLRARSMPPSLMQKLIRRLLRALPEDVKTTAFKQLASNRLHHLASMNIEAVAVRGKLGLVTHSVADCIILPSYAKTGTWAPEINTRLVDFFKGRQGTYIDIGANIGLTTIPVAQNPNVDCIAIEPDPSNFRYLSTNIAVNCPHNNVTLHQVAAFSETGVIELELSPDNLGDHRIRRTSLHGIQDEHTRQTIQVKAVAIDNLVKPAQLPLAVKIDTQGAEPFVIQGARRTLERASLLIIEFWPYGIHRMGGDIRHVTDLLKTFESVEIPTSFHPAGIAMHFDAIATKSQLPRA